MWDRDGCVDLIAPGCCASMTQPIPGHEPIVSDTPEVRPGRVYDKERSGVPQPWRKRCRSTGGAGQRGRIKTLGRLPPGALRCDFGAVGRIFLKRNEGDARVVGWVSGRKTANAGHMIRLFPSSQSIPFISLKKSETWVRTGGPMVSAEFDRSNGSSPAGIILEHHKAIMETMRVGL